MKYVFDSRNLADRPESSFVHEREMQGVRGSSWMKPSVIRMLLVMCVAGTLLYFFLGHFFVLCIVGTLLMVFRVLLIELIVGLMRQNNLRQAVARGSEAKRRNWAAIAWCVEILALVAACTIWYVMVVRKASADVEHPQGVAAQDGLTANSGIAKASGKDIALYVESTPSEVRQLFEYVRQSAFVQENAQYAAFMKDVAFAFDATNNAVNAVASREVDKKGNELRLITCYAGEARFAKTIALAAAAELCGHKGSVAKMMKNLTPMLCVELSSKDAVELVCECGLDRYLLEEAVLAKAKSIAAGSIVGVLAHEIGHQVLGHNYQSGKDLVNNEVRRNFESQADLFASSVMSSSPFGEYVFAGRVFALWVRMRQTDPILRMLPARKLDHPIDRERFVALVLANKEKATALGIAIPEL